MTVGLHILKVSGTIPKLINEKSHLGILIFLKFHLRECLKVFTSKGKDESPKAHRGDTHSRPLNRPQLLQGRFTTWERGRKEFIVIIIQYSNHLPST